jgi:hypothetical protein
MIPEVFLQIIVRHYHFPPRFSQKLPEEAETARNSLFWNILYGTSLLSIFCSETMPVTSRKQGICLQNTGGGTRWSSVAGLTILRTLMPISGRIL